MDDIIKEHIRYFIATHGVLVLAVARDSTAYASPVFYVTDDAKMLYFKSRTNSNHSIIISENPRVSAAIYNHSSTYNMKAGIQLIGSVKRVLNYYEMSKAVRLYSRRFKGAGEKLKSVNYLLQDDVESTIYKLVISKLKMVDNNIGLLMSKYESWV